MTFDAYLESTTKTAESEKEVLDILCGQLRSGSVLGKIELRAARASLQILIDGRCQVSCRIFIYPFTRSNNCSFAACS